MWKSAFLLSAMLAATSAAAQSPATGPQTPNMALPDCTPDRSNAPCKAELGVSLVTNMIRTIAQQNVDAANARLQQEGRSARASVQSLQMWGPQRTQTQFHNQPNSFHVRIPYILTIKIAIPVTSDRRIGLPIDINVFCSNWHTDNGQVVIHSRPGPASFEGGNILEDVFNVGNYIDSQVRAGFNAPLPTATAIPNSKCATIGASDFGTAQPEDDLLVWSVPRQQLRPGVAVALSGIEVTFDRLKRLPARALGGGILYKEVEDILLNAYANQSGQQKALSMREGEETALGLPAIRLEPAKYDTLVILGNIGQPPNNPRDSAFAVAAKAQNYRPGTHVLQIPKWYSQPPSAQNPKPSFISVPAYELTYTVRNLDSGTVAVDPGTAPPRPPRGILERAPLPGMIRR